MIGQCQNCRATVRVGSYKDRERNRAHKQTINCKETYWARHAVVEVTFVKGRCPICGAFPVHVLKWGEKVVKETEEEAR